MTQSPTVQLEPELSVDEFIDVLKRSSLSERRPVECRGTIKGMLRNADVIATARAADGLLVGVSRCITDFQYCTYLSDLAVDESFQKQGIGRRLIEFSHEKAGRHTNLVLVAAPAAHGYYGRIGMERHPSCWIKRGTEKPSHEEPDDQRDSDGRGLVPG